MDSKASMVNGLTGQKHKQQYRNTSLHNNEKLLITATSWNSCMKN